MAGVAVRSIRDLTVVVVVLAETQPLYYVVRPAIASGLNPRSGRWR